MKNELDLTNGKKHQVVLKKKGWTNSSSQVEVECHWRGGKWRFLIHETATCVYTHTHTARETLRPRQEKGSSLASRMCMQRPSHARAIHFGTYASSRIPATCPEILTQLEFLGDWYKSLARTSTTPSHTIAVNLLTVWWRFRNTFSLAKNVHVS